MNFFQKRYFLSVCLILIIVKAYPLFLLQQQNIDTLYKEAMHPKDLSRGIILSSQLCKIAKQKKDDIALIKGLNLLAEYFWEQGIDDSAKFYGYQSLNLSEKYHVDSLRAGTWVTLGLVSYDQAAYDSAINKYKNAVRLYKNENKASSLAITYKNIGICERKLSRFNNAITYFFTSIKIFELLKDNGDLADVYNSVALCFVSLKNYPKAIEYNKKALAIRLMMHDGKMIAQSLNNTGFAFKENHQPDSSIVYLSNCLAMRAREPDSSILVLTLQNLGSSWKMKGDFRKAESYILRSLNIAHRYNLKEDEARGNLDLSEIYTLQKKYAEALTAVNITANIAQSLKLPELLMDADSAKYNLYLAKGDYKQALYYSNKQNRLKDSLFTISKNNAISELEIRYQTQQKEKDITALNLQNGLQKKIVGQQKRSIIMLIVFAVLLMVLFVIAYKNFRNKHKANQRIQLLMRELHHRVKNNLQVLSGIFTLQLQNSKDEGIKNALRENESRLVSMNLIHHKLYADSTTTQIEMKEYLTSLLQHIKKSFGQKKQVSLEIDAEPIVLEATKAVAIGLIINELATNAFKYAFDGDTGRIRLELKQTAKSKILLTLRDNGKGIPAPGDKATTSFGLKLVNLMVNQLKATLVVKNENGAFYQMEIDV